jgi:hypothetical protein
MKGWREHAADIFTEQGSIAAEMKFAPASLVTQGANLVECT